MNILDLPIEEQRKHASQEGMTFEAWQAKTKKLLASTEEYVSLLNSNEPFKFASKEREEQVRLQHESEERGMCITPARKVT